MEAPGRAPAEPRYRARLARACAPRQYSRQRPGASDPSPPTSRPASVTSVARASRRTSGAGSSRLDQAGDGASTAPGPVADGASAAIARTCGSGEWSGPASRSAPDGRRVRLRELDHDAGDHARTTDHQGDLYSALPPSSARTNEDEAVRGVARDEHRENGRRNSERGARPAPPATGAQLREADERQRGGRRRAARRGSSGGSGWRRVSCRSRRPSFVPGDIAAVDHARRRAASQVALGCAARRGGRRRRFRRHGRDRRRAARARRPLVRREPAARGDPRPCCPFALAWDELLAARHPRGAPPATPLGPHAR